MGATARWRLLEAAVVLATGATVVWVVAHEGDLKDLAVLALYTVLPAAAVLAAAAVPSLEFRLLVIAAVLAELCLALIGAVLLYLGLWAMTVLGAVALLHMAALFTRLPRPWHAMRREIVLLAGAVVATLAATAIAIPDQQRDVVACVRSLAAYDAVFDRATAVDGAGVQGVPGSAVTIHFAPWTSDEEVTRLELRLRATDGVTRVARAPASCPP